jgi:hypothetical protein
MDDIVRSMNILALCQDLYTVNFQKGERDDCWINLALIQWQATAKMAVNLLVSMKGSFTN